jgi:neutral/alkaline ceramidase-like enzyme
MIDAGRAILASIVVGVLIASAAGVLVRTSAAGVAPTPHRTTAAAASSARPGSSDPCPECLRAGAASVPISVPDGTPLAGYGSPLRRLIVPDVLGRHPHAFWLRPHTGQTDSLRARALVLETDTARVVWIAADLIAVDREFTDAVARRLPRSVATSQTLVISASHTHSGPGAFLDSEVMGLLAVDRPDREVRETIIGTLVEAVHRADAGKMSALVGAADVQTSGLIVPRTDAPLDSRMTVLKVVSRSGRPIAVVWNYAIHATMLGARNLVLSGDVTGVASRELERQLGVPALFVNGAVGDVSPAGHGEAALVMTASALATRARGAWGGIRPRHDGAPRIRTAHVDLPPPALPLRNCVGRFVPRALALPLGRAFPREAVLTAVALGDVAWVTIPGELQSALGLEIKRAAGRQWRHPFVAGLSNDYLGYFPTAAEWQHPGYVSCASLYGPEAGERLAGAASTLLLGLVGARERTDRVPIGTFHEPRVDVLLSGQR